VKLIETKIDGEDVVLIGTALTGYTAILSAPLDGKRSSDRN